MQQLLRTDLPTLAPTDTASHGLLEMEEFHLNNLPVLEGNQYMGIVTEDELLNLDEAQPVQQALRPEHLLFTRTSLHWLDAKRLLAEHRLSLLPVLDEQNHYAGSITAADILYLEGEALGLKQPGGVIVLYVHQRNYHLSQIAQIVESDDASILDLQVTPLPESGVLEVTLKINKTDLGRVLHTFRRYDYEIAAAYHQSNLDLDMKDRYEQLMRFLNP